jgi:hypothetical protein
LPRKSDRWQARIQALCRDEFVPRLTQPLADEHPENRDIAAKMELVEAPVLEYKKLTAA